MPKAASARPRRRKGPLENSLGHVGKGLAVAAQDWNPLHPKTSLQASLLLAAVVSGLMAVLFARAVGWVQHVYHLSFVGHPYLVALVSPVFFVAAVWSVRRFAPEARGSGIPQVLQAIDRSQGGDPASLKSPLLSLKTALWKVISTTLGLMGGASIGREGPTVQIASSIFAFLARHTRRYFGTLDSQAYLVAGASAGISAAFNTPLAGITFALEEIAETTFSQFKRTVMLTVIVGGITSMALEGTYLYFGRPFVGIVSFGVFPLSLLMGALGGVLGGIFSRILTRPRWKLLPKGWFHRALACALLCSAFGLLSHGDTSGSGYEVTKQFMDSPDGTLPPLLFPEKFLTTAFSYLSGMAGGIFSPCLSIGAGFGSTLAGIFHLPDVKACALIGMVAFFSGVVQAPLTAVIIIMEMTDQSSLIIPFLLAAFTAQGIGRLVMPVPLYRYLAFGAARKPSGEVETKARSV